MGIRKTFFAVLAAIGRWCSNRSVDRAEGWRDWAKTMEERAR